ncbi:MAG: DUF1232 domain-containing protein [Pseudomonadota bacterium]
MMLVGGLAADDRLPSGKRMRIGLAAAYLLSPLDLIPDWIPVLGQIDDVVVAALLLDSLFENIPEEILHSHWKGPLGQLHTIRKAARIISWLVPSRIRGWFAL